MSDLRLVRRKSTVFCGLLMSGAVVLNGCSSAINSSQQLPASPAADIATGSVAQLPESKESETTDKALDGKKASDSANKVVVDGSKTKPTSAPLPQKPQLIKTADLTMRLESIDKTVVQIRRIVQSEKGDIYNFQDDRPPENNRRQASLVLKVPSAALDDTLLSISKLGQVQSQAIKSNDVTQQLVDTDARLKSLRQQEDMTRKIMERSGSVKDILAVSNELAKIRQQIEQMDATVKNMRQQVAYSTINLKVEEIKSATPTSDPLGVRAQETWKNSTHAASGLATNLALVLLWLLPFSPFLALGAGALYYYRKRQQPKPFEEAPNNSEV
jgi:hypothetical protein